MKININKTVQAVLLFLILAMLAFIFIQSMIPPEESLKESDKVGDIVADIIPPESTVGEYIQINLRKIAHFVEFAILAILVSLYVVLYLNDYKVMLLTFPISLILAVLDETIQIFSKRGASVKDIWIDFLGFAVVSLLFYTVYLLSKYIRYKCK